MKKHLIISAVALGLVACGGDEATVTPGTERDAARQGLVYAYPAHEQLEVPTPAPIVLRFSSAVVDSNPEMFITVRDANGDEVPYSIETGIGDGQGLVLTPDERLAPRSEYTVEIDGITLERGAAQPRTLTFTTKGLTEGPRELVASGAGDFELLRKIPDGSTLPIMDFSSFRLQFNQPLDRTTVNYGSSVALEGPDGVVDAHLIVHGPYMTVDPKEDLTPGVEYTLSLHSDITSTYGDAFSSNSYTFTPLDSGSRSFLTQEVSEGTSVSMLTGKPVNMVPLEAVLLGDDNQTQQSGFLQAELAHIPTHPDFAPLRIKRGSMLSGTDMEVLIGGEVPAGFSSGEVKIHFISDAVGYLERNPYFEAGEAPQGTRRQLRLFMDVAITAEDPRANGAVTQDILHLELIGTAEIRNGRLTADAVSVAEPRILGSEDARSVLSFFMQSLIDLHHDGYDEMPTPGSFIVQSWVPEENSIYHDPKDPIIINMSGPIDGEGISALISLQENGIEKEFNVYVDGASLVIHPLDPLKPNDDFEEYSYLLYLDGSIKEINGSSLGDNKEIFFDLGNRVRERVEIYDEFGAPANNVVSAERSPIVLSVYPGFPCALDDSTRDLDSGFSGRCLGGFPGLNQGTQYDLKPEDDLIPIGRLASDNPIVVQFSKEIDPDSIQLGGSFSVAMLDENDQLGEPVPGRIDYNSKRLLFWPDESWTPGVRYAYQLGSNGDRYSSTANCDGTESICDLMGNPLQTALFPDMEIVPNNPSPTSERDFSVLTTPIPNRSGGPPMTQYFVAIESNKNVLQSLVNAPSYDQNSNFWLDIEEVITDGVDGTLFPQPARILYSYSNQEVNPAENQPIDPSADQDLDPNGVVPPKNSAKILSRQMVGVKSEGAFQAPSVNGANIGCGYETGIPWDNDPFQVYGVPLECPTQKFTYLTGAIIAEVTDEFVQGMGQRVKIWPGQIMATSLAMRSQLGDFPFMIQAHSGAQLLRMRYQEDQHGERVLPIDGWITSDFNGNPIMNASVEVYMDGLELSQTLPYVDPSHSLMSHPVKIELSGPIEFMDDGRMMVEQRNTNVIDIDVRLHDRDGLNAGVIRLRIPEGGNRINYVSDLIK